MKLYKQKGNNEQKELELKMMSNIRNNLTIWNLKDLLTDIYI